MTHIGNTKSFALALGVPWHISKVIVRDAFVKLLSDCQSVYACILKNTIAVSDSVSIIVARCKNYVPQISKNILQIQCYCLPCYDAYSYLVFNTSV